MAKRGRPSKYQGEQTIEQVYALATFLAENPEKFLDACGVEQIADALGIATSTLYEWEKTYPDFSEAIKIWRTTRDAALYKLAKSLPPAIWIFMTKNMLCWRDQQEVRHSGTDGAGAIRIEVVHLNGDGGNGNGGNGGEK